MTKKIEVTIQDVHMRDGGSYNHIDCIMTIDEEWEYEFKEEITEKCEIDRREFKKHGSHMGFDYAALFMAGDAERSMTRIERTNKFYNRICDLLDSFLTTTEFEIKEEDL